ncbi:MAG: hypothetical protein ACP5E4_01645 [Candidatus Aenigmatarchaeota archaeon]
MIKIDMDWDDFSALHGVFGKNRAFLHLGDPELLQTALANAKEVVWVTPEKPDVRHSLLKVIESLPEELELDYLPRIDTIVNCLPLNLATSMRLMGRYMDALNDGGYVIVRLNLMKEQEHYMDFILKDTTDKMGIERVSVVNMDGKRYFIGKKA